MRGRGLGVIREGKAGEEIAQLAKALGMTVSMWSREVTRVDKVKRVSKNEILTKSEYIVVAVSDNEANRELMGREEVEIMSEEAVVINVAGRGTVNEQFIKQAVKQGKIASYTYKRIPQTEESLARKVAEFVKHIRNGSAHNNRFNFSAEDVVSKPAKWRDKAIERKLNRQTRCTTFYEPHYHALSNVRHNRDDRKI